MLDPGFTFPPRQLFLAWFPFQRRQISMSQFFGFQPYFMPHQSASRLLRPIQYIGHALKTLKVLRKNRPNIVWVQLPPSPLLTAILIYKHLFDKTIKIVADCHNSTFNPLWLNWPAFIRQLNSVDAILVHNHAMINKAVGVGIRQDKIYALEDPPAFIQASTEKTIDYPRPWVLFLTAFASDEPIAEIYSAAALAPDLHFVIAGDLRRAAGRHKLIPHPPNIVLAGYIAGNRLDATIEQADAILALTRHDNEQLSTAAEAVGAGKAMVLADTAVLRDMYARGAIYVIVTEPSSIAWGCRSAIAQRSRLEDESVKLRDERWLRWRRDATRVASLLEISHNSAAHVGAVSE
jgi:glycosyltransferase involved in cell wall biosynthesis